MIYNYFLENIILPVGDLFIGQRFIYHLKRLRKEVLLSENELQKIQIDRLSETLLFASSNVPYYKKYNNLSNDNPIAWLKKFPVLDKYILKNNEFDLLSTDPKYLLKQFSSGSSGIQSVVYWTKEEQSIHRATQILWWEWSGYNLGMPIVQSGITPNRGFIKGIKDKLLNTYYFLAFSHDNTQFDRIFNWAFSKKKVFLGGYASSLYVLSQYALKSNKKIMFYGGISWGDKLFDHYRSSILNAFNVNIHETYGSSEGLMIAAQKDLNYLYVMSPNVFLEILDDDGNEVPDGVMGNVIVTSLVARGMPLIRFKIGDLAIKLPKNEYPIKRDYNLPLLKKVIGRDTDLIKTRSGKFMVVHSFTGIFEHISEIRQFCIIQENLDGIKIEYISSCSFNPEILTKIKEKILFHLNEPGFFIEFNEVNHIKSTPSGKPQLIQSKLL